MAMSGAKQNLIAQNMASNNLANASTAGFRADLEQFRSMPLFGEGFPTRVFSMSERPGVDASQGGMIQTGNPLDVAINGNGWVAVQAPDGSEAYTRAGNLRLTANGQLQTISGHPVLGNGGPILIPPAEKVEIGVDGTISLRPLGQEANVLAVVDRIKLVKSPDEDDQKMEKGLDGLFRAQNKQPLSADAFVKISPGMMESSNVNAVEEMVKMITLAREFEMQIKAMKAAEEGERSATEIMRMG